MRMAYARDSPPVSSPPTVSDLVSSPECAARRRLSVFLKDKGWQLQAMILEVTYTSATCAGDHDQGAYWDNIVALTA